MKKLWKIMLIIVLVPVLLLGGCYYLLVGTAERVYTNLNNYERLDWYKADEGKGTGPYIMAYAEMIKA